MTVKINDLLQQIHDQYYTQLPEDFSKALLSIIKDSKYSMNELKFSSRRILSSSQLIDFFVGNMLDLCILREKPENFAKSVE